MSRESHREIVAFLVLGLTAFVLAALLTGDVRDYLDGTEEVRNFCGPAGAFVSYHLTSWVGRAGAFGIAGLAGLFGLLVFFRRRVRQRGWKAVGSIIMVLTLTCSEVAIARHAVMVDTLPGGFIGQYLHEFLLGNLSSFGTYLILTLAALVAFMISTDTVFYPLFLRVHRAALDPGRWSSLWSGARSVTGAVRVPRLVGATSTAGWSLLCRGQGSGARGTSGLIKFLGRLPWSRRKVATEQSAPPGGHGIRTSDDVYRGGVGLLEDRRLGTPETSAGDDEDPDAEEPEEEQEEEDEEGEEEEEGADDAPTYRERAAEFTIKLQEPDPPARASSGTRSRAAATRRPSGPYKIPPLRLLEPSPAAVNSLDRTILEQTATKIEETLRDFKIEARVVEVQKGPTITQFELSLAAGIKVHKIVNLSDDLAMALKAPSIRIVAPIPGKSTVGVEVPNRNRSTVGLRELVEYTLCCDENYKLPLALGRDAAGAPVVGDLGEMPHLLIAGSTGSGKSVCINSVITNILVTRTPDEVKLILVDPKMVELAQFENIPHLLCPVVTDMKKAPAVLAWLVEKMDERYELLALAGVRHITSYNALGRAKLNERLVGKLDESEYADVPDFLPSVVVIIDELADLMMTASKEVEASITRLSQKSRAVGIHVIVATQRPSVDVITGLIKANMPSRISFRVASRVDSRTILDRNGAEKLLGKGDMLYLPPGTSDVVRVQGTFISDKEIREVVEYATQEAEPQFNSELTRFGLSGDGGACDEDELYEDAVRIVLESQRGSVTLLQRQLQIGYTRASRLMELMHERGLVGPFKGSKAREVFYTLEDWEKARSRSKGQAGDAD